MLDKERRLRSSSQIPPQALIPRRASPADVRASTEYKQVQLELESERRVKADLMANLKEVTSTNEASKATLLQEIAELKAKHESARNEYNELNDTIDDIRIQHNNEEIKDIVQRLEKETETKAAALDDIMNLLPGGHIAGLKHMNAELTALAELGLDIRAAIDRIDLLTTEQAKTTRALRQSVPSAFEDLFSLLNRNSSFAYPAAADLEDYTSYIKSVTSRLSHTIKKYITSHQKSRQKISYRGFGAGDLALFLPTRNAQSPAWAAFNVGAPHFFLEMTGVDTEGKDFLIGRIQDIEERIGEPGVEQTVSGDTRRWWQVRIVDKRKTLIE